MFKKRIEMKKEVKYQKLTEVSGRGTAEMLESYLKANGIAVQLIQDAITHYWYASSVNAVEIFVPNIQMKEARALLEQFENGQ